MEGYKILVSFNPLHQHEMAYRRFIVQRWLPAMQELGLVPGEIMQTIWGDYADRLIVLYVPDEALLRSVILGEEWQHWHEKLRPYVHNLRYRVVEARPWLQL